MSGHISCDKPLKWDFDNVVGCGGFCRRILFEGYQVTCHIHEISSRLYLSLIKVCVQVRVYKREILVRWESRGGSLGVAEKSDQFGKSRILICSEVGGFVASKLSITEY